jgi:alpha-glucosidase/alpha-D-xyloside xylohydrolase
MFMHRPYNGRFDLRNNPGQFLPVEQPDSPKEAPLPVDIFVTNVDEPSRAVSEYTKITGKPAMPPKWALGYMQSHRNLSEAGPEGVMDVARTFREKELPVDALIYLGRYTAVGWNKAPEEEFEFHPESFPRPQAMLDELHDMNYKVSLHLTRVPEDLHGNIPPHEGETVDEDHVASYWDKHKEIVSMGIDGWWPDMGDPLDNDERLARHYMYREGPLQERPNERPWSLHRTGFAGMQRFGGWNWSGDVISSWETLAAHIPVGLNASVSTSPFWGTDIAGFYPPLGELTGELYVRWFQFGAFTPSFRAHGRIWRTRLPWGWNPGEMGPVQLNEYVKGESSAPDTLDLDYEELDLHTTRVEPIIKDYLELRYRLMPYLYTTVREAHDTGLPPMRAMWLHYPDDPEAVAQSNQYLWGRDMLVAPVVKKDANVREIYLPEGKWYDFWGGDDAISGRQYVKRFVDLETMPIYVRAGTILPLDPVRQYVDEPVDEPTTLRIYPGNDGEFELYNDDGRTLDFQEGEYSRTLLSWDDQARTLTIEPSEGEPMDRQFRVEVVGERDQEQTVDYQGERKQIKFKDI